MKSFILLFTLLVSKGEIKKESGPHGTWSVTSTKPDATVGKKEAYVEFTFQCPEETCAKKKIQFTKNGGKANFVKISAKGTYVHKLAAGETQFEFMALDCYNVKTDKIKIEGQTRVYMTVSFEKRDPMMKEEKPVIYLYPTKPTNVTVQLSNVKDLTFTYPKYAEDGWNVLANTDGTLKTSGKEFNYLFWEGKIHQSKLGVDLTTGFIVKSDTVTQFLENALAKAGLNTKESEDFITWWAPRLSQNEFNFVHFNFTEQYDAIAKLDINPLPDSYLRLFMLWAPLPEGKMDHLVKQEIPLVTRKGFTVVEWGGTELPEIKGF
jgi:hypothetical protein